MKHTCKTPRIIIGLCALIVISAASSCATLTGEIPEDMPAVEYFQKAQEAINSRNDYKTALIYYNTFLERFPQDTKTVEALYEIAFIYYKRGDLEEAETRYSDLVSRYRAPGGESLPRWPYILAVKHLEEIKSKE